MLTQSQITINKIYDNCRHKCGTWKKNSRLNMSLDLQGRERKCKPDQV